MCRHPCRYLAWYGVQGIFLDEGSNLCTAAPFYDSLVAYIKAALPSAVTVLNWGVDGPECFFTTPNPVDIVLNYENTYAEYVAWAGPSAWVNKYNASRCVCAFGEGRLWYAATGRVSMYGYSS